MDTTIANPAETTIRTRIDFSKPSSLTSRSSVVGVNGIVKLAELDRTESRHARLGHAAGTPATLRHSINRRLKAAR